MTHHLALPPGYSGATLGASDIDAVMSLQTVIFNALPPAHKDFIILKNEAAFIERMTALGAMQGVYWTSPKGAPMLAAYGSVVFPTLSWPIGDLSLPPTAIAPYIPEKSAIMQSCSVHPEHRGKGLHRWLVATREEVCAKNGRCHIFAEIAAENPASLKGYLVLGYHAVEALIAPEDQCKLLIVHKNGAPPQGLLPTPPVQIDPSAAFAAAKVLLASGWRGVDMSRAGMNGQYWLHLSAPAPQ